jgi:glycosyltransferase involved in cell wall biosynthesis
MGGLAEAGPAPVETLRAPPVATNSQVAWLSEPSSSTHPAVSVILPTYERLHYLKQAVESVRSQTATDWELIVVDDGSTDGSADWVDSLGDVRIRVLRRSHNGYPSVLRNLGVAQARADWIAFLDSDDVWRPEKLASQRAFHATHEDLLWSYTGRSMMDAAGEPLPPARFKVWEPWSGRIVEQILDGTATIALPTVMVRKSLLNQLGGFDESRQWTEDFDLWLRLSSHAPCGLVDEPLTVVRLHRSNSHDRPEVDEGFMAAYRSFASATRDMDLRRKARRREGYYAIWAANKWVNRRQWRKAIAALATGFRLTPLDYRVYRCALRFGWRFLTGRSTADGPEK